MKQHIDVPHLLKVQQIFTPNQKHLTTIWYKALSDIWHKQTMNNFMYFSNFCGKLMVLLSIQIKLAFNDMLDKSYFQHAYYKEPKTFHVSCPNQDGKDLNFLTNKRWVWFYLSSQHVGDTYTRHKKEHNPTCGQSDVCFTANASRVLSLNTKLLKSFAGNLEAIETLVADHGPHAPRLSSHAGRTGPEHWPPPPEPGPGNRGPEVSLFKLSSPGTSLTQGIEYWC